MIDDAERLDSALSVLPAGGALDDLSPALRALVVMAGDVGEALSTRWLSAADHDRIYATALMQLEASLQEQRHLWNRVHLGRRGAVISGAAATVVTMAAIGMVVVHERHKHRVGAAA